MSPEDDEGPWDPATEHDDSLADAHDSDAMSGDDPPTTRASLADRVRVRVAARQAAAEAAGASGRPSTSTLPPPTLPDRLPAQSTAQPATVMPQVAKATAADEVIMLDKRTPAAGVSLATAQTPAAGVSLVAARVDTSGGFAIVAGGTDADHVRKLCQAHGLVVPVVASLAAAPTAAVVVIGEPALPIPDRVAHVVRPSLDDTALLQLLRSLIGGRVVADPPVADGDARVAGLAQELAGAADRETLATLASAAIKTLAGAERARLLFTDGPAAAGATGWATHTGHPVYASPAGDDPRYLLALDDPEGKPQSRLIVQPVIGSDRRVHGVLVAARRWRHNDFTDAERAALRSLAAHIAPALDAVTAAAARKPRATLPGVTKARPSTDPATQSALVSAPRPASDSRPPPVTARRPDSRPPPVARDSGPHALAATAPALPAAHDSSPGIAATQPAMPAAADGAGATHHGMPSLGRQPAHTEPAAVHARASSESERFASEPRARAASESERPRSPSEPPRAKRRSADGSDPLDVAVVATMDDDIARVRRIARKARLEVSVHASASEVPPYYRVVTIGEAWTPSTDARVAYAARATITDEQLLELLVGLSTDRAPAALVAEPPQNAVEAKRMQLAFGSSRKLATAADLAEAETHAIAAATALVDADRAYCVYYNSDNGALWSETRRRSRGDDRRAIAGVVGWAARTGRSVNVPRASADPRWLGPLDDADGDPNSQLLVQPVLDPDRRVLAALIAVRRPKRPPFSDLDVTVLQRYAALAGPLLQQLQLATATEAMLRAAGATDADDEADQRAIDSPVAALVRRAKSAPRWAYAGAGALLMLLLARLIGC